jgi:hypothetical protein
LTCEALIGTQIPGRIEKVECEPYEYTIRETGETVYLRFKFVYVPEIEQTVRATEPATLAASMTVFAKQQNVMAA